MTGVGGYLLRRVLQVPLVALFVTLVIFMLLHVTPGDPVQLMLGEFATPASVAQLQKRYDLDQPLPIQYVRWLGRVAHGDLGDSIRQNKPVSEMVRERFPISFILALAATFCAIAVALPAGLLSAVRRNTWVDYVATTLAIGGLAIPNFALALILILVFAVKLDWLPITGIGTSKPGGGALGWRAITPYILPVLALAAQQTAILARQLRASMVETLDQDYIRTARAKGLRDASVILHHAMRNALIPVVTIVAIQFGYLVGTTITIEFIFGIPGMGSALLDAVVKRDFPVIQGFTLCIAVFFVAINILADLMYAVLDPRIHYG